MIPLRALPLLALIPLAACVVPIPVPVPEGTPGAIQIDPGDPCGARRLQSFVGQAASVVEATRFESPGPVRILRPGEAATEDFNAERLNFRIDASGRVAAVGCG